MVRLTPEELEDIKTRRMDADQSPHEMAEGRPAILVCGDFRTDDEEVFLALGSESATLICNDMPRLLADIDAYQAELDAADDQLALKDRTLQLFKDERNARGTRVPYYDEMLKRCSTLLNIHLVKHMHYEPSTDRVQISGELAHALQELRDVVRGAVEYTMSVAAVDEPGPPLPPIPEVPR